MIEKMWMQRLEEGPEGKLARHCLDEIPIALMIHGPEGQFLYSNRKAREDLGYAEDELQFMNILDIDPVVSFEELQRLIKEVCSCGVITFETTHRRKDGGRFPVEVIANLLEFGDERFTVSYVRDITEQKAAAEQKARMQAQLRKALRLEALGTLAGGIAHDFRNVLTAINNYSELTCMKCDDPDSVRRYHEEIGKAVERANQIVHQIHDFSRRNKTTKRPVDMDRVIDETLRMMRSTFPETIRITHDRHPDPGIIYADETRIHQVIMNLCANACNAMSDNGGNLDIRVAPVTIGPRDEACSFDLGPGRYVKLSVADTGHGMDASTIERAFDPYFTTNRSRGGAGMGLAIVHGVVKDHGGAIKVVSEPGKGTSVAVYFPLAESLPDDPAVAAETDLPTGSESILIVDDVQEILDVVKALLEELGYGVEARPNGIDALETFEQDPRRFDLVMTDYFMPGMKGDQLARQIKESNPDTPIILFTAFSAEVNDVELARCGITEVLHKPLTLTDLAKTIRKTLDGKKP